MQIKVEATSKEATKTAKGEYTGIKYSGKWVNVWGNHVGTKGQTLDITTPEQFKQKDGTLSKTFWAKVIEEKVEPEPAEEIREDKPTIKPYATRALHFAGYALSFLRQSGWTDEDAMGRIVNTIVMQANGEIEDDLESTEFPPGDEI